MPIPVSNHSTMDASLRRVINEISIRAIDGTTVPLFEDVKNGRVGINTSTPSRALDVVGEARISSLLTLHSAFVLGMLSARNIDVPGTGSFNILTAMTAFLNNVDLLGTLTVTSSGAGAGIVLTASTGRRYRIGVEEDDQNNPTLTLTQVP